MKNALPDFEHRPKRHKLDRNDVGKVYPSRRFSHAPGGTDARALLQELAAGTCRAAPVLPGFPLVIYGAGTFGRMALDFLNDVGIEPALVVDAKADQIRASTAWAGIDLLAPHEVPERLKSEALIAVSIVTSPVTPILTELQHQGWQHAVPFYDVAESLGSTHPLSNGWFAGPIAPADLSGIMNCLDGWADDLSRAHHLMFLAWRLARQEWQIEGVPVDNSNRFFIPEVLASFADDDLFVDGGAHHGNVSQAFISATGPASRVIAFEPDAANADHYAAWLTSLPDQVRARIELRRLALDARSRPRRFQGGFGFMSQLAQSGTADMVTETIDAQGLAPGFVKLHLEGGELDALRGGLASILQSRPIIAVTVYHNADGLWRTARFMHDNLSDYSLLMRNHSWCGTGAVVYALPNERMPQS